ncbi:hypothetical protein [Pseudomonas fontis]|uniref:Uncharacterized protein n=1 Tax=Pseudomonas fontis TaxID=2942633 RepID=A0ABT5NNH8_9PSED|nr:hypothetical protein [Pseudomonas fontis]MDD0973161.1 hypothetical protein [Pseudomonas fontis]MDD0989707.1 hypothetical protein [Pseudomonas fontis]
MNSQYVVVLEQGTVFPQRELLISEAWGEVPVSYFQDQEISSECTFLDLKVNKWEINSQWSSQQDSEPWIRIEILKGKMLEDFLQNKERLLPVDDLPETLLVFELDDAGTELDDMLLLRLVSVFHNGSKIYRWCDGFQEVSEDAFASMLTKHVIRERLIKCK